MKLEKGEISIFIIYGVVFAYTLLSLNLAKPLPLTTLAIPIALTLLIVFILHMLNLFFRTK